MKKKLLILSACIGLILACFPFTISAEEDPQSDLGVSPPPAYYQLDDYFWDNYDLLSYVESDGSQYIDTGIKPSANLDFNMTFSGLDVSDLSVNSYLFGSSVSGNVYNALVNYSNGRLIFYFMGTYKAYQQALDNQYDIYNYRLSGSDLYLNNTLVSSEVDLTGISNNNNIYIFNRNPVNTGCPFKLYSFSLYDNEQEEYLRYYYPAKAKSGGTIGLYDAVSKTFVSSASASPFENPQGSQPLEFDIGVLINSGLGWISDILDFAITEPLIICFMAIGLAGAMFRWGRRLVHF